MHTPTDPDDPDAEAEIAPDHAAGAFTNCECAHCRERRLADDRHHLYTPHDMADAFTLGWQRGYLRASREREAVGV